MSKNNSTVKVENGKVILSDEVLNIIGNQKKFSFLNENFFYEKLIKSLFT